MKEDQCFFFDEEFFFNKIFFTILSFSVNLTIFYFFGPRRGSFQKKKKSQKNTKGYYEYIMCYFAIIFGI